MIPRRKSKEVVAAPSVFPQEPISAPTPPPAEPVMPSAPRYVSPSAPVSGSGTINLKSLKARVVQAPQSQAVPQTQPPRVTVETNGHTISLKKMQ